MYIYRKESFLLNAANHVADFPQVVSRVPSHTSLLPTALPGVAEEVAGVEPGHDELVGELAAVYLVSV